MMFAKPGRAARGVAYFALTCLLAAMLLIVRFRRPPEIIISALPGQGSSAGEGHGAAGSSDAEEAASAQAKPAGGPSEQEAGQLAGLKVAESEVEDGIAVHVAGCVAKPGLYKLKSGARVNDALLAAGGMTKSADSDSVNIALPVRDGQQVYIPARAVQPAAKAEVPKQPAEANKASEGQVQPPQPAQPAAPPDRLDVTMEAPKAEADGAVTDQGIRVDINSASAAELDTLPGIGPATAAKIIEYREKNGLFTSIEQLMDVSGIGPAKYEAMREMVVAGR